MTTNAIGAEVGMGVAGTSVGADPVADSEGKGVLRAGALQPLNKNVRMINNASVLLRIGKIIPDY
ncbi:MAG: hypothetical protein ABFC97_07930 [Anaerolineaceae bacterium]